MTVSLGRIKSSTVSYLKKAKEKDYDQQLMEEFLREIEDLGEEAVLYCDGWWQEPNISLYLDKDMHSIYNQRALDREHGYFIVGRRFDGENTEYYERMWGAEFTEVDSIEVDYNRLYSFDAHELFSIYKIH